MSITGQIEVFIKNAKFKSNYGIWGDQSPYIILKHDKNAWKTSVQKNAGTNPVWDEKFVITPYNPNG